MLWLEVQLSRASCLQRSTGESEWSSKMHKLFSSAVITRNHKKLQLD